MNSTNKMRKRGDIPNDVIADILSRSPSQTVFRFKIVSKAWYVLISDPVFIKLHSQRVSSNPKILLSTIQKSKLFHPNLGLLDYEVRPLEIKEPINFPKEESPLQPYKIIGSSWGLVCIATDYCRNFYFWNPTTRESRKIPNISSKRIQHYQYIHGLGYDSTINDFKVVISLYPNKYTKKPITFHIFSLRKYSWKRIVSPFRYFYNPSKFPFDWQFSWRHYGTTKYQLKDYAVTTIATVLNGVFHWIVRAPNEDNPQIIAFDSTKETFYKLQIPKGRFYGLSPNTARGHALLSLLEQNGCLCLFCYSNESRHIKEIWMMKEYGNHRSWIHLHNIALCYGFDLDIIYKPLCITRNTELSLHTVNEIYICRQKVKYNMTNVTTMEKEVIDAWNLRDEKSTSIDLVKLSPDSIFGAALVDETLASPHLMAHKSTSISIFNRVSRVFYFFWVVINFFMNLFRD